MKGEQLLKAMEYLDYDLIEEAAESYQSQQTQKPGHTFRGKRLTLLLVAALVIACAVSAYGISQKKRHEDILQYMGISQVNTTPLDQGNVDIQASDSQMVHNIITGQDEEITFRVDGSVGDNHSAYIKISTDITLPDEWKEKNGHMTAEVWECRADTKKGRPKTWGGELECIEEEGHMVFMMHIQDMDELSNSVLKLKLGGIVFYEDTHEEESRILTLYESVEDHADGDIESEREGEEPQGYWMDAPVWNLTWRYQYETRQIRQNTRTRVKAGDVNCYIDSIDITPLMVKVNGHVSLLDWRKNIDTDLLRIEELVLVDPATGKEETVSFAEQSGGSGWGRRLKGLLPNYYVDVYENMADYGMVLEPCQVISVKVNGRVIAINRN